MSNEEKLSKVQISWYPGHMAKAKRIIEEDLKLIDIVIEVIDARIPVSSRNPDLDKIIKDKKRIIILNKSDLADEKETKKWKEKLTSQNTIAIIANSLNTIKNNEIIRTIENMMKEKKESELDKGRVGRTTRVMIVGIPNVGKSSIINRLSGKNSLDVKNKPGVTTKKQWIRIANNIELMDTPGILWPKFDSEKIANNLAFTGTIKDDIIEIQEIAYELIKFLNEKYQNELFERYKIHEKEWEEITILENPIFELIKLIARKRGAIVTGGKEDIEKTARIILDDYRSGKIGRITLEIM